MSYRAPLSIFLAALVLLLISSRDTFASHRRNYPLRPPDEIEHTLGVLRLQQEQDSQRVSVTFWSADDAASRIENIKEAARARSNPRLTHIGVNVGDHPDLAAAYLRRDALDNDTLQLFAAPEVVPWLISTYGYRTVYR